MKSKIEDVEPGWYWAKPGPLSVWSLGVVYPHDTITGPTRRTWHGVESKLIADLVEFDPVRVLPPGERNTESRDMEAGEIDNRPHFNPFALKWVNEDGSEHEMCSWSRSKIVALDDGRGVHWRMLDMDNGQSVVASGYVAGVCLETTQDGESDG